MGLTGIGGAAITTPILILIGISPLEAVGSDLVFLTFTKSFGSILHIKRGNIDFRIFKYLVLGSLPSLLIGYFILSQTLQVYGADSVNRILSILIATLLIFIGLRYLQTRRKRENIQSGFPTNSVNRGFMHSIVGFLISLGVQMTSIGGGSLLMPYLIKVMKEPRKMIGTDLAFGFIIALLATLTHLSLKSTNATVFVPLIIGAIPGLFLGIHFASKTDQKTLLTILPIVLMVSAALILIKSLI